MGSVVHENGQGVLSRADPNEGEGVGDKDPWPCREIVGRKIDERENKGPLGGNVAHTEEGVEVGELSNGIQW